MAPPGAVPTPSPVADAGDKAWCVYVLRCADGSLYTGCTNDLPRRLGAHGRGRVKYTRGRLPVALFYSEPAPGRGPALRREAAIKGLPRARKLALAAAPQTSRTSRPAKASKPAPTRRQTRRGPP